MNKAGREALTLSLKFEAQDTIHAVSVMTVTFSGNQNSLDFISRHFFLEMFSVHSRTFFMRLKAS